MLIFKWSKHFEPTLTALFGLVTTHCDQNNNSATDAELFHMVFQMLEHYAVQKVNLNQQTG